MNSFEKYHRILAGLVFLLALGVYVDTIAPTTSFWDCGEFITCSYILGVPHPPGAPFYVMLGRIFSMLPVASDIGMRVNLLSAVSSALTVTLAYLIIVRLVRLWRGVPQNLVDGIILSAGGLVGSLAYAFSDSFWFNAEEAEVYAISMFFTAIVVWLILVWAEKADDPASDRYLLLIAYSVGLAVGVHLLNILALPAVFLVYYFRKYKPELYSFIIFAAVAAMIFAAVYPGVVKGVPWLAQTASVWSLVIIFFTLVIGAYMAISARRALIALALSSVLLIAIGYSTYTMIFIRSNLDPAVDENDPETIEQLVSYLNREQYGDWSITDRARWKPERAHLYSGESDFFWNYQMKKMYWRYFFWNFFGKSETRGADGLLADIMHPRGLWMLPFLVGLLGLMHHFVKDRKHALVVLTLFVLTGVAIVVYLNQEDPQPRERDYVYVASFFAFALWIGIGASSIIEGITEVVKSQSARRAVAWALAGVLLLAVPVKMLAFNYESHDRTGNYVAYDYSYNILQTCEPNAIIFTNGDNDTFPLWFLQYVEGVRPDVRVVNLSLLNTSWYIKQLKNEEPRIAITLTDDDIDGLRPTQWPKEGKVLGFHVPRAVYQQEVDDMKRRGEYKPINGDTSKMVLNVKPTFMNMGIRVQDWMVLRILFDNKWRRPVYFAVTVSDDNKVHLGKFLRMEGLAFRVLPFKGFSVSPSRLRENLYEKYVYRGLDDPEVYLNYSIMGLLQNYRSAFLNLASYYRSARDSANVLAALDQMAKSIPENLIPIKDERALLSIGKMYYDAGRPEGLETRIDAILGRQRVSDEERVTYAMWYDQVLNKPDKAESIMRSVVDAESPVRNAYIWLVKRYDQLRQYDKVVDVLEKWVNIKPSDKSAQAELDSYRAKAAAQRAEPGGASQEQGGSAADSVNTTG